MRRLSGLALVVILTGVFTSCGSANGATSLTSPPKSESGSPITIQISLDDSEVMGGTPIKGQAVLNNRGSATVTVKQCAVDGWLVVGLTNKQIQFDPTMPLVACPPSIKLAPGKNRFPVRVVTTYEACLDIGDQSVADEPPCVSGGGLPSLPPGNYKTKVVTYGLPARTPMPRSIRVVLTAKH
jgi:hypothetical protein